MKKLLTLILTLCMMATVFCVTAFAVEPSAPGVVIRVSGQTSGGQVVPYREGDYTDFEKGWEAAIDLAEDSDKMKENDFKRVVVDFYADWNANNRGEFGDSGYDGFQYSTIYVPKSVRITMNLNGHTINRGLKEYEYDGEVICIEQKADVIINDGTITGGWSCNGAGGIHIQDNATVVLNNVNVVGNKVEDDDGTGIAVYDGATLTMNGGSVSHNTSYCATYATYGGGVYVEDSNAFFTDVTFENNQSLTRTAHGAAIYVDDGTLVMDNCLVKGNGLHSNSYIGAYTIIDISDGSDVTMIDTDFLANGCAWELYIGLNTLTPTFVIKVIASSLTMDECTFTDNNQVYLISSEAGMLTGRNSDFTGNDSFAFYGNCANISNNTFTDCRFSYTEPMENIDSMFSSTFYFNTNPSNLTFIDCDFGEATFNDKSRAVFVDSDTLTGSMIGEGSLPMVVAVGALIISVAALGVAIASNKKNGSVNSQDKA